jgi:hypothetical protein
MTLPNGNHVLVQRGSNGKYTILGGVGKQSDPKSPDGVRDPATGLPLTATQANAASLQAQKFIGIAKQRKIPLPTLMDKLENEHIPPEIYTSLVMKAYGIPRDIPSNVNSMKIQQLYRRTTSRLGSRIFRSGWTVLLSIRSRRAVRLAGWAGGVWLITSGRTSQKRRPLLS